MRYSTDEALAEIKKRGKTIKYKRDQKITRLLSCLVILCTVSLIALTGVFAKTGSDSTGTVYGSFVLYAEAGEYVIISLAAFLLGIVTVFVGKKLKGLDRKGTEN